LERKIVYFEKPGPANTEETLRIAKSRAEEAGIKTILVASARGETGARAAELFEGYKVIVVSHSTGLKGPDTQEFTPENRKKVESKGATILTMSHAFRGGAGDALRKKFNMRLETDVMAYTLRILGQGIKVGVEMAIMAADAGLVRTDEHVICISGTVKGADTAILLKPANSIDFFDIRINEILCKPYL
jgi:hypothetical protein